MRLGKVEATGGFFLLLAWLNYVDRQGIVPLAMAACLLHELGHYLAIRCLGGDIKSIRLTVIGAEMLLPTSLGYWREGVAALAGPGVNLVLAALLCRWQRWTLFTGVNLVLGCFNLMPVGRLDGGRALYCTLALLVGPDWADRVGKWLDLSFTVCMLAIGVALMGLGGNVTLLLVALWLTAVWINGKKKRNRACQMGRKRVK